MPHWNPYSFTNQIENINTIVRTRGVRIEIPGARGISIQVSANKVDNEPWQPPSVQIPQSKILYDQWRDLTQAVEQGFAEYAKRFTDEKMVLIEEKTSQ
jgi:hypothetical protein